MNDTISFAEKTNSGTAWTPEQMLLDSLRRVQSGGDCHKVKKAMVIFLDDNDGAYNTGFQQAGMRMSECVALCEVAKIKYLREMEIV